MTCFGHSIQPSSGREYKYINGKILEELSKGENIVKWIKGQRISWLGHLERMEEDRMPRKIFTQELEGMRRRGRPRKGWREEVERDLQVMGVRRWRELVIDREKWRGIVRQAKAHSGLQHQRKKKKWESEVQKRPGPALPDDGWTERPKCHRKIIFKWMYDVWLLCLCGLDCYDCLQKSHLYCHIWHLLFLTAPYATVWTTQYPSALHLSLPPHLSCISNPVLAILLMLPHYL